MTLEETLASIDTTLKSLLSAVQSGAQMSAATFAAASGAQTAEAAEPAKKTRAASKKTEVEPTVHTLAVLEGDPEGTRYWVSEDHKQVYTELPGTAAPADPSFKMSSSTHYTFKKAEFDIPKPDPVAPPAATVQAPAATEPSAAAQPAGALVQVGAQAAANDVTWDDAVGALKSLATNPAHGSAAVVTVIKQIDPAAANVPALKALGKNAEIVAAVNAILNPVGNDAALFG